MERESEAVAVWVTELRKRLNLTQSQFGDLLGVSQGTVVTWEAGRSRPYVSGRSYKELAHYGVQAGMPPIPTYSHPRQKTRIVSLDSEHETRFKELFG